MPAEKFLRALFNDDPITFRAIQENGQGSGNVVKHGPYNKKFIEYYNDQGYGIFFTPNSTGGNGTKDSDVKRCNAVFIDIDESVLPGHFALEPSAILSRDDGQGHHVYWFLHPTDDINTWRTVQKLLISVYHSDKAIINPARLMRLPGTVNNKPKRNGQRYQVKRLNDKIYDLNDVISAHTDNTKIIKNCREYQKKLFESIGEEKGERHHELIKLVTYMTGHGFSKEDIYQELEKVNKKYFNGSYSPATLQQKLTASDYAKNKKGEERIEEIEKEIARRERVQEALQDWYYVQTGNYFVHVESLDIERSKEGMNAAFANVADLGNVMHYAFLHNLIKQAEVVVYEPGKEKICAGPAGLPYLNIWKNDAVPTDDSQPYQWFVDHISYLMSDKEAEHFLNWLAYAVQNPGKKIMHAFLIIGGQGIGKSIMFHLFKALFGPSNARAPQNENLNDKYTKWAKHTCFCLINELKQDGNTFFYNAIKPYITEEEIEIREMYRDPYTIRNTMNILAFSNDEAPIRLEEFDRRWYVVKSHAKRKTDEYYEDFIENCERYSGGVRAFLESRDLSKFNPGQLPETTEAKQFIIDQSKSDFELWLKEQIDLENGVFSYDIISIADIMLELPLEFKGSKYITNKGTAKLLKKYGAIKIDQAVRIHGDVKKFWIIRHADIYAEALNGGEIHKIIQKMYESKEEISFN